MENYLQPFNKYEEGLEKLIAEDLRFSPFPGVSHSLKSSVRRSICTETPQRNRIQPKQQLDVKIRGKRKRREEAS